MTNQSATNPEYPSNDLNSKDRAHNGFDAPDDFIRNLVKRCASNPRYVFTSEVIERLASLKQSNRLAFETLRARLKETGRRITALDDVIADVSGGSDRDPNQTDILVGLVSDIDLFYTAGGTAYADIDVKGRRET